MKTLILGLGAFGFAIAKHLTYNNPNQVFYGYDHTTETLEHIGQYWTHPYFFPGVTLPSNMKYAHNLKTILPDIDILIIAIPVQRISGCFEAIKESLKSDVIVLSLSKWVDNETLQTPWELLWDILTWKKYHYGTLSWGMIASELVKEDMLWADIVIKNQAIGEKLVHMFASPRLHVQLVCSDPKTTELYSSLKNVFAIILGYYQVQGLEMSSIGYYACKIYREIDELIGMLWGEYGLPFSNYSNGGDIIATCFWNSRNKYFGTLIGSWNTVEQALEIMANENKLAEGYYTFKGIYPYIQDQPGFEEIKKIGRILIHNTSS